MITALVDFVAVLVILVCVLVGVGMAWRGMTYRGNETLVHALVAVTIIAALICY